MSPRKGAMEMCPIRLRFDPCCPRSVHDWWLGFHLPFSSFIPIRVFIPVLIHSLLPLRFHAKAAFHTLFPVSRPTELVGPARPNTDNFKTGNTLFIRFRAFKICSLRWRRRLPMADRVGVVSLICNALFHRPKSVISILLAQ